jgi:phospholipid transport system substrate-binding protein
MAAMFTSIKKSPVSSCYNARSAPNIGYTHAPLARIIQPTPTKRSPAVNLAGKGVKMIARMSVFLFAAYLACTTVGLRAQAQEPNTDVATISAYDTVFDTTERVMEVLKTADDSTDEGLVTYIDALREVMDDVVDYRGFSRAVMGNFASKRYYMSLSDEGRATLRDQLEAFTEVMSKNLVETYAKGLIAFAQAEIEVVKPDESGAGSIESVYQKIKRANDEPYLVEYKMRQAKDGSWQLVNVIIEDVNLGDIYRSQFDSSAKKYARTLKCESNDSGCFEQVVQSVIDNWGKEG